MSEKKNLKVLYVEDEDIIREAVGKALSRIYETVILCENGEEALKAFSEFEPDIILSDIEMPVMGGKEFIRKIKEKSQVPCIMLTAYKDPEYLVDFADKTLFKPVALYDIVSTIDSYFQTN
jgi:CheY-like chemotaxis protein